MQQWVRVAGVRNQGLINRRTAEIALWNHGAPVASASVTPEAPVPQWRRILGELRTKMHGLGLSMVSGGTYAAHQASNIEGQQLQDAGQKIQTYASAYHTIVALGVGLCIAGVLIDILRKRDSTGA
jgi:hypothetical protein